MRGLGSRMGIAVGLMVLAGAGYPRSTPFVGSRGWANHLPAPALQVQAPGQGSGPVPAAPGRTSVEPESEAPAAVVAQAEAALAGRDVKKLAAAFGGAAPAWARIWVERRGHDDLFDRQWHGRAVRLPAPYHGTEWLGVFSMYHPVEADADHFHRLVQRDGQWTLGPEIDEREPAAEYQITHHELRVRVVPAEHRMEATDRMTVHRLAGALSLMLARMNDDYEVREVRMGREAAAFARVGGLLAVVMPPGPPADIRVQLSYGGVVRHPGMDSVDTDVTYLFSYWYPNVARLPATGDIEVTAPAAWTVIAQGEQERRKETGGETRSRWRQTHPVCWLQFAAGPYRRTSRTVGDKTLNVYLLAPNPQKAEAALNSLAAALPFYSRTFAPFPWTHYDVVEYPMAVGALESYSFTAASLELMPVALPHELAHSWWGGLVPNPYTVDMWNEAFATYSERLLKETTQPGSPPGARPGEDRPRGRRFRSTVPIIGAADALYPPHSSVGYGKGAAVLHMFRRTVGEEAFHRTLSRFASEMAGKAATWRDFQQVAERVAGGELGWFFDPWLTRGDTPRLRWGAVRQDGKALDAEIEMANPAYRLRLPIAIDTSDGKRRIEVAEVAGPSTHFHRELDARALRLVLDPAADFVLEPADPGPNPWTIEVPPSVVAGVRRQTSATRLGASDRVGTSSASLRRAALRGKLPSFSARKRERERKRERAGESGVGRTLAEVDALAAGSVGPRACPAGLRASHNGGNCRAETSGVAARRLSHQGHCATLVVGARGDVPHGRRRSLFRPVRTYQTMAATMPTSPPRRQPEGADPREPQVAGAP